jgi:hypothetical protein
MAHYGIYGSDFRNASKVAATQGMFDGVTDAATMDSEMGLPVLLATIS